MNKRRVYFIKPVGMDGPIKVGCSHSPDGRRKTLETWSPFALEIIAEIEGGEDIERRFHALFYDTHQRGEWFDASAKMTAVVAAINGGSFDIEGLPQARRLPRRKSHRTYTPEWRYESSLKARWRHRIKSWPWWNEEFRSIIADGQPLLAHKAALEDLLVRLEAKAKEPA